MNLDTTGNARRGVRQDDEMEDIDLEGGRTEKFGNAYSDREMARQRDEEKLAMAGLEHRRASPNLLGGTRSPSPLSIPSSPNLGGDEPTPRAAAREEGIAPHASVLAATNRLRRPPPIASPVDPTRWNADEEKDVVRGSRPSSMTRAPRTQREASTTSITSEAGLLEHGLSLSSSHSRANSPPIMFTPIQSPAQMFNSDVGGYRTGSGSASARSSVSFGMEQEREMARAVVPGIRLVGGENAKVEDMMEEISLDDTMRQGTKMDEGVDGEGKRRSWVRA